MNLTPLVQPGMSERDLVNVLRVGITQCEDVLPESLAWHAYVALRELNPSKAAHLFLDAVRQLHGRRGHGSNLSLNDPFTHEHRMVDDPLLSELWRAYKRCLRKQRVGPAGELLKDIEARLS